ncbi:Glutamine synthetase [uncultured archaeon]|nr:Glutamine synthetase [uncultured archaeon]
MCGTMDSYTSASEKERILADAKKNDVRFVDFEFVDIPGMTKNTEMTTARLDEALTDGVWFDGSSIEGFVGISESDMFLIPDSSTYAIQPWTSNSSKTMRLICDVYSDENKPFAGDPRGLLKHSLAKAKEQGYDYKVGPELEFFIFKGGSSGCGCPGAANDPESAMVHDAGAYFDNHTRDEATELRRRIVPAMEAMGLRIEMSHHEVAPGQHEIDFRYNNALVVADSVMTYKTVVRTLAQQAGLHASFMPKPVAGINGSGMHVHQSLWKDGKNTFHDSSDPAGLSQTARYYIAGILDHARAIAAVTNPTVNSYKRLVPGYEAPVYVAWGRSNRSALIRIPKVRKGFEAGTRAEVRFPDPSCNPYLAFSVMLAAGLDGIAKKTALPKDQDDNLYHLTPADLAKRGIKTLPASLKEAMEELASDDVLQKALGSHIYDSLSELQRKDWDAFRTSVTDWEKNRYFSVL